MPLAVSCTLLRVPRVLPMIERGVARETGQPRAAADAARLLGFTDVAPQAQAAVHIRATRIDAADYVMWGASFADLAARADAAHPFFSPARIAAVRQTAADEDLVIIAAHDHAAVPARLVGIWAFRLMRDAWSFGLRVLQTPVVPVYDCNASPLLDKDCARSALAAIFAQLRTCRGLPRTIRAASWPEQLNELAPDNVTIASHETWARAMMRAEPGDEFDGWLCAAMGRGLKKRRAQERALARMGEVCFRSYRRAEAVRAFEDFLVLEASGWKGKSGTALAQLPIDAAQMRGVVSSMALVDQVAIDAITLDGRPVAMGLLVEAGNQTVFWKTAFDEQLSRHSPGVLLDMAVSSRLFKDGRPALDSGMMEFTNPDTQIWPGRMRLSRATITTGAGAAGVLVRCGNVLRYHLRLLKRRLTT